MASEFESGDELKDRTKWVWLGIVLLVFVMVVLLWVVGRPEPKVSVVRARHILIKYDVTDPDDRGRALDLATELRERILNGESFPRLAKRYSDDTFSAVRGGDLGYQAKGTFRSGFEEYAWNAPLHELSDIVKTSEGFHLIRVEDRIYSEADLYEQELAERIKSEYRGGKPTEETNEGLDEGSEEEDAAPAQP